MERGGGDRCFPGVPLLLAGLHHSTSLYRQLCAYCSRSRSHSRRRLFRCLTSPCQRPTGANFSTMAFMRRRRQRQRGWQRQQQGWRQQGRQRWRRDSGDATAATQWRQRDGGGHRHRQQSTGSPPNLSLVSILTPAANMDKLSPWRPEVAVVAITLLSLPPLLLPLLPPPVAWRRRLRLAVVATWRMRHGGGSFSAAAVQQSKGGGGGCGSLAAGLAAVA